MKIAYSPTLDEFSVACSRKNFKIWDEFCVRGYYRSYDGMSLLKHALHNTCPDMMKSIGKDENGNDIKVRDSEGIQLANAKIDEIRNGFTEWLEEQSPQFKERLTTMYNRKFNCFVRPKYDGSHQTFPDLNLKRLASRGIQSVYPSQKDCVWTIKQNGGGICDREVGTGKTLIMCIAAPKLDAQYKYTYNNGHLAMADPLAAARKFLNALERIPSIIDQYKAKNEVLEKEIPQLQEIVGKGSADFFGW